MTLDLRSLGAWVRDIFGWGRLAGGMPLGTPSLDLADASPSLGQETTRAVSGGGTVGPDDEPAHPHTQT